MDLLNDLHDETEAMSTVGGDQTSFERLDSNYVTVEHLTGLIALVVVLGLATLLLLGLWFFRGFDWISWIIIATAISLLVLLTIASFYWPSLHYRHTTWKLDNESLEVRSGVLWKRQVSVPLGRVQHADVSQGPLQRRYGLGKLIVYTAGTYESSVELEGLNHQVALQLRDRLIRQTQQTADAP